MRNAWTIAKREFNMYFASPVAYAVGFTMLVVMGLLFVLQFGGASSFGGAPDMRPLLSAFGFLTIFYAPALTMRLIAEEQRSGTIELLLTAPLRDWELVVGKWLASLALAALLILTTVVYALIMNRFVTPGLDLGALLAAYLGVLLFVAASLAIGVFVSSLFTNQVAAFFGITGILLVLWLISNVLGSPSTAGAFDWKKISFYDRFYTNFLSGTVALADVVFFLSVAVFFLFLAIRVIESRRWR